MDRPLDEQPVGHWTLILKETLRPSPEPTPDVLRRQTALIYRNLPAALAVNAAVALALGWRLDPAVHGLAWTLAVLVVNGLRYGDSRFHRTLTLDPAQLARARRNLRLGAAGQGILWGIAGTLLVPAEPLQQLTLLALVGTLAAGGLLTLAPIWSIYALYLVPSLVPISLRLLGSGQLDLALAGALGLIYLLFLLFSAARTNRWLEDSLLAARDNRMLLDHLRTANDALLDYHAHLEDAVAERTRPLRAALAQAKAASGPRALRGRVLVVDDQPALLEAAQAMLERLGLEVATAGDGLQAMEYMERHGAGVDLVLLDLAMPVMDGRETFRALRRLRPSLPIILSSGDDPRRVPRDGTGQPALAFLRKPYSLAGLEQALEAVLAEQPVP